MQQVKGFVKFPFTVQFLFQLPLSSPPTCPTSLTFSFLSSSFLLYTCVGRETRRLFVCACVCVGSIASSLNVLQLWLTEAVIYNLSAKRPAHAERRERECSYTEATSAVTNEEKRNPDLF